MKKIFLFLTLASFFLLSCKEKNVICDECNGISTETYVMYIFEEKVPCPDDPTQKCFMEQHELNFSDSAWTIFNDEICGFEFKPGFRYKLKIKRKKIGKDDNGNKVYKYCLLDVLEAKRVYL